MKRIERASRIGCKNIYACFVGGEKVQIADPKKKVVRPFYRDELEAMGKIRHKWTLLLAVLGVDDFGKRYIKTLPLYFPTPCLQSEICEITSEYHHKLLDEFNPKHFKNAAWLGSIVDTEFNEEEALGLFEIAGAFEHDVRLN